MSLSKKALSLVNTFVTNKVWPTELCEIEYFGTIIGGEEPSKYSKSPFLWNKFFKLCGLKGIFTASDLPLKSKLGEFISILLSFPECVDITITSPYKNYAYCCLDSLQIDQFKFEISERVQNLECLNHIIPDHLKKTIYIDNTDGQGMILALKKRKNIDGAHVLLVGAGGAAASIGYELVKAGADLKIVNIIKEDAETLGRKLDLFKKAGRSVIAGGWEQIKKWAPKADIIVSAISASTPLSEKEIAYVQSDCLFADTRYGNNGEFAIIAKNAGRPWVDGKEMLYGQFELAAVRVGNILGIETSLLKSSLETIREEFIFGKL